MAHSMLYTHTKMNPKDILTIRCESSKGRWHHKPSVEIPFHLLFM